MKMGKFCVSWMNVRNIDMLTASTAQMTLECSDNGFASCMDRKEVDILIALVQQLDFLIVRDRISISHLRIELKSFLSTVQSARDETDSERVDRETKGTWSDEVILPLLEVY